MLVQGKGAMAAGVATRGGNILKQGNWGAPIFLLIIMAMMTLPMPSILLDVLFTFNIALALVVLLVSVFCGGGGGRYESFRRRNHFA